jgi:integrase
MRSKEIKSLAWANLDGDVLKLLAKNSKGKKYARLIPMDKGKLAEILKRRREARKVKVGDSIQMAERIFHHDGRVIGDFRKSWASACKAGGKPGFRFHDLRRSAVRAMNLAGVPRTVARKITGHRTDSMYDRYSITTTEDVAAALDRTEKNIAATGTKGGNVVSMQK